jgi:branched-chain amino acid transport system ATP-binding protein
MTGATALLRAKDLSRRFGGLLAVSQFSCEVFPSEIVGLIGPNGAGKSTVFNLISGFLRPTAGEVWFREVRITGRPAATIARLGLTRTFQHESFFKAMSVRDNVLIGTTTIAHGAAERARAADEAIELFGLGSVSDEIAGDLPHGYQRLLSMAIASATRPVLLCLDEPLTGLNQTELVSVLQTIRNLRDSRGMSILFVEHNVRAVMTTCDRIVVLNQGSKLAEGSAEEISRNQEVIDAYLGQPE